MASFIFDNAAKLWLQADQDLLVLTCKVALVTTASGVLSSRSAATVAAITTLSELSSAGYVGGPGGAGRRTVTSPTVSVDATNRRVSFDGADLSWAALGTGYAGLPVLGALLYQHASGADDALNIPIAFIGDGGFPYLPSAAAFNLRFASTGLLYVDLQA